MERFLASTAEGVIVELAFSDHSTSHTGAATRRKTIGGSNLSRKLHVILAVCLLNFVVLDTAHSAKPAAKVLLPSGNTIAGPGSFDLAPDESAIVFRSTSARFCTTLVVTAPDVVVRLNMENYTTLFATNAASQALCNDFSTAVEIKCEANNLVNCTGFWRVDYMP